MVYVNEIKKAINRLEEERRKTLMNINSMTSTNNLSVELKMFDGAIQTLKKKLKEEENSYDQSIDEVIKEKVSDNFVKLS